ncbi:MAG: winged helix-turn-helix domain-containing protein [Nitrososphaeraceae archaeon]
MNPKYRSRIEIISSILEASVEGAKKSKVMHRSFVSNTQFKLYMNHLIEKNLLSINSESKLTITPKGLEFLDHFHALESMLDLTIQKQSIKNDVYSQYLLPT